MESSKQGVNFIQSQQQTHQNGINGVFINNFEQISHIFSVLGQICYKSGQFFLLRIRATVILNWGSSFYYKFGHVYWKLEKIYSKSGHVLQFRAIVTNRWTTHVTGELIRNNINVNKHQH